MERILAGTSATISATFQVDGTDTDPSPDTATVAIVRADGTVLQATTAATNAGIGKFTFLMTPTQLATLDILTASWTATLGGQVQTLVTRLEVVGGFLCSLADITALLQSGSSYTAAQKASARFWAEVRLEKCIGRSFVPRYSYETLDGSTRGTRYTPVTFRDVATCRRPLRLLRSVETRIGTTWTAQPLTSYELGYSSVSGYFPSGWRNVRIGYEYGEDFPSEEVAQAAALWAKVRLVTGPIDDRELQRFVSDTGAVVNLSTPGRGSWSGIPDVDAVIESEKIPLVA